MTIPTQTRDKKTIHPKHCDEMAKPRQNLREQWEKRHNELQDKQEHEEKPTQREKEERERSESKYVKKPRQTYIIQLVQKYPEMPYELKLNDNRRKQLAELMLEYPTKNDEEEQENPPREQTEEKRHYTCQNCKKEYSTIRGKLNHLEAN